MSKILIDENLPSSFAEGINYLQLSLTDKIQVTSIKKEFGKGVKDEDWIPAWGGMSGVFVTQDLRIYSIKQQSALLTKYNIGAFFLKLPKGYRSWDKVQVLIKHWKAIIKIVENNSVPYTYFITARKVYRA